MKFGFRAFQAILESFRRKLSLDKMYSSGKRLIVDRIDSVHWTRPDGNDPTEIFLSDSNFIGIILKSS